MGSIPASLMRGGTSKGLFFLAEHLPSDEGSRNRLLLALMGSPDARQIDGIGGAHPLTSKVAIVAPSEDENCHVDYLFLQVVVDKAQVSDTQNCGNILAGVGPFAIEQGLVKATGDSTDVRIRMVNTNACAVARVSTPGGIVSYEGDARIDGVPGTAAPVLIDFLDVAGSSCGSLFPTGNAIDEINGIKATCIDNGMPVVMVNALDLGLRGDESPAELETDSILRQKIETLRLAAGRLMNLGDVSHKTVPKISLLSPALNGGSINTRTFIPHRVHEAIGVLGSVSVATACAVKDTVAWDFVELPTTTETQTLKLEVEHPTGAFVVEMDVTNGQDISAFRVNRAALLRTARLLMRGDAFVPSTATDSTPI